MLVVEMLGLLGELHNDPDEERFKPFNKLVRLNAAQLEIMPSISVRELANLAVYNHFLAAAPSPTNEQTLPANFYKELSVECVRSVDSGRVWRMISPETRRSFPFGGSRYEPVVKRSAGKLISFGRLFDEDVYFDYYRLPAIMTVEDVADGFQNSSGSIIPGVVAVATVECELPETVHSLIVQQAYRSFLISDQEIKEVPAK